MQVNQCRVAPSLGALEGSNFDVWGTREYYSEDRPAVFFGLYGLPDFYALWRHVGTKWILWCGSDITHFQNGYWLEEGGGIRVDSQPLAEWINKNCDNWVENEVERQALADMGIDSKVCPSFMGNVDDYGVEFKYNDRPNVYLSANEGREVEYGWNLVEEIADKCDVDFHLYGSDTWTTKHHNVFIHGRVTKREMNNDVMHMQCGLRLNETMDGFSEITAKSILWGQHPLVWAAYKYPHLKSFKDEAELVKRLNELTNETLPHPYRDHYKQAINKYPWNTKQ